MCGGKKKSRSSEPSPCLVYTHSHKKKDHLIFCSLSSNPQAIYRKPIPKSIGDSCIVAYSCGWFLLSQDNHTYFSLWNNKFSFFHDSHDDDSFIHLPPLFLKPTQKISHFFLSSSPDEDPDNSMVLLFEKTLRSLIFIRPSHENSRWIEIPYGNLVGDSLHGCVSCNGKLYSFTSKGDKLVRLEVDKQDHLSIQQLCSLPERKTMNTVGLSLKITYMNNLIECCGELFNVYIVVVKSKGKQVTVTEVCVFKLDFDTMIWERANNLMGHAVFFNALGDSWCPVFGKGIIEADSIYFTLPNDQSLYSFNVKDDCLSVSLLQCPKLPKSSSCSSPKILVPHRLIRLFRYTQENQVQEIDEKEDTTKTKIQTVREISFSDLPLDCVIKITDGLNLFEYWNLRAVCRDWRFVVPKLSRKETLQRFTTFHSSSSSMWLLFLTNNMTALKFVDAIHGTSFLRNLPESLKGSVVRCSSNGWLLMCDQKSSMSFFNPFTEEIIKLQDTPTQVCALSCVMAFSHTPTSPYCKVVGCGAFRPPSNTTSHLHTLVADIRLDNQWEYAYEEYGSVFWLNNTSPLYFGGAFFLLGQNGKLSFLHYNLQPQIRELSWVVLNQLRAPCKFFHQSFLVEFHGRIVSIFVGHMGKWLKAFRLDFTEMRWEELESIGNNVIYVSQSSCVCKEARIAGTENRIYFPRFHGNIILYYSFGTREFHVDGEGIVERFYNTKEPLMATWIEPTY